MGERFNTRAIVVSRALAGSLARRSRTAANDRILVAHNLLLGDTLSLTPLLAKLRANHPAAQITLLASPAAVPLYERHPYGVQALPFRPSDSGTARALLEEPPFDLAYVVGDNRYSWLAAAMGARHIVAHAGDTSWTKDIFVDERREYEAVQPTTWGDMVAALADGLAPPTYARGQWLAPAAEPFDPPRKPYAVLHVGASTPLKQWLPARWRELAARLESRGLAIAWSAGRGEESVVAECDPEGRHPSYAGRLSLAQLWHLVAGAALLVAPDTGVAYLGRVVLTPTVTLFGPGCAPLCGNGEFWGDAPWRAVVIDPFECRDQRLLFRRRIEWVRRCTRSPTECAEPRCMHALSVEAVLEAIASFRRPEL
ncbi:MAG TPA: glycosyltransferase family 9 protein [Usitatibacter sp.]|nr:glycosyltransferase family 9 protein [Usitatibacter sp.]